MNKVAAVILRPPDRPVPLASLSFGNNLYSYHPLCRSSISGCFGQQPVLRAADGVLLFGELERPAKHRASTIPVCVGLYRPKLPAAANQQAKVDAGTSGIDQPI